MARILTADNLVESVKRRAMIPEDQVTFEKQDFLDILNEEMKIGLVPSILKVHEEYFTYTIDVPLVNGQDRYRIPHKAIGNKIREVMFKDLAGNFTEMTRISIEDVAEYRNKFTSNVFNAFYLQSDEIVLMASNQITQSGYLSVTVFFAPNELVEDDRGGQITAINTSTGVITLSSFPTQFSDLGDMDFIAGKTPNKIIDYDITPTAADSNTKEVTFNTDDIPSTLAVGDYICSAGETIVPQCPAELIPLLSQRAATYCLESLGDSEGLARAREKQQEMEANLYSLIDNRVEGAPQKIVNRFGPLRSALARGGSYKRGF